MFVLKEVLENLDKRSQGAFIYEIETNAHFFNLVKLINSND